MTGVPPPIGLTPSGEVYIDAIEKLFALEQNTINQLNNLNGLLAGKLTIGGTDFSDLLYPSQPSGGSFPADIPRLRSSWWRELRPS